MNNNQGNIVIHLEELLKAKELSRNKFAQRAEMQRTQLNKYIRNEVTPLNIDVLARMCSVLECDISDLLGFRKEQKKRVINAFFPCRNNELPAASSRISARDPLRPSLVCYVTLQAAGNVP